MLCYRLTFEPDDNGSILVTSPDFPVITYGDSKEMAVAQAVDAITGILASMMDAREDIPASAPVTEGLFAPLPLQTKLKVELYIAMRAAGMTRADLQRKLGWQRESIDRLFRLDHNSRIEQLDDAFRALGKDVSISVTVANELQAA